MPDTESSYPFPSITSFVNSHSPQADAIQFHSPMILKGWLPHMHLIPEDMDFELKQALGKHMELFHAPDLADRT